MKRGRDLRSSGLCDSIALSKPFWQASGAMLTAHFSHPSSSEVCPDLACYALLQKKDMKAGRETICFTRVGFSSPPCCERDVGVANAAAALDFSYDV